MVLSANFLISRNGGRPETKVSQNSQGDSSLLFAVTQPVPSTELVGEVWNFLRVPNINEELPKSTHEFFNVMLKVIC